MSLGALEASCLCNFCPFEHLGYEDFDHSIVSLEYVTNIQMFNL